MLTLRPPPWNASPVIVRSDFTDVGRRIEHRSTDEARLLQTSTAADYCYERRSTCLGPPSHSKYVNRRAYYQLVWLDVNGDNGEVDVQQQQRPAGVFLRRRRRPFDETDSPPPSPKTRQGEDPVAVPRGAVPPAMTAGELLLTALLLRGSSGERTAFRMRPILAFLSRIGAGRWQRDGTSGDRTASCRTQGSRDENRESTRSGGETRTINREGVPSAPPGSSALGQRQQDDAELRAEDVDSVTSDVDENAEFNVTRRMTSQREIRGFPSNQDLRDPELLTGQDATRNDTQIGWKSSSVNAEVDVERDDEMSSGNSVEIPTKTSKRIENFQRRELIEAEEHHFANTEKERGSSVLCTDLQSVHKEYAAETHPLVSAYAIRRRPSHEPSPVDTRLTTRKDAEFDSLVDRRTCASTIETKSVTRKCTTSSQRGNEWTEVSSVEFSTLSSEEEQLETTTPEPLQSSRTQRLNDGKTGSPRSRDTQRFVPMFANHQTDIVDDPQKTDGHRPAIEEEEEEEQEQDDYWLNDDDSAAADGRLCLRGHEADDQTTTTHVRRLRRRSRIQRRLKTETTDRLGRSTFTVVTSLEDFSLEVEISSGRCCINQAATDCPGGSANTERNDAIKPPMEGDHLCGIVDIVRWTGEMRRRENFSDGDQSRRCPGIEIVTSGDSDRQRSGRRNASNNARPWPRSADGQRRRATLGDRPDGFVGSTQTRIGADRERKLFEAIEILETQQAFCLVLLIGAYIILSIIYSKLE